MQKISQSELSKEIKAGNYKAASALLPKKIEQVFEQPKVREMIQAIGELNVKTQIEFELINLASLMSVGGNLNKAQITFICEQLIDMYPNESIADFKICFQRGSIGAYGDIQRMDGITVGQWMKAYLEEKYELMESNLMTEKENIYKPVQYEPSNIDWHKKWLDEIESLEGKAVLPMTDEEIKKEGQEDPAKKIHLTDHAYLEDHRRRVQHYQELTVRERHPEWTDEQVKERLAELKSEARYTTDAEKIIGKPR